MPNKKLSPAKPGFNHENEKTPQIKDDRINFLCGFPGLGPKIASALLTHFENLEAIFTATQKELTNAPGIGPKLASKIHNLIKLKTPSRQPYTIAAPALSFSP